ncbi:MAG: Sensor protein VraS [Anaerolineae bacterium]|nr:Sensor protein VraS [Anaerolineae bacterium]
MRKHARATRVTVAMVYDDGHVSLSISDDGQGMGDVSSGYGLLGLRERAQLVGGTVNIETAPNQGCRIDVEIPT